ncbi:MAG: hypothetical protein IID61_07755 [SAR324 cluster bacterium]|nr:hypothetical protein [SAR324 cluster bacterium]
MKLNDLTPGLISVATGLGASLCCVLPLSIVALGLGSGAFMMVTMQFRPILYPMGLLGLGIAYFLFFRRKRQCDLRACKMAGGRLNLSLLIISTVLMGVITYVDFFLVSL